MGLQPLSDRARRILTVLVREYIETGGAVSSHALAEQSGLGVSPATIRNTLAQLETDGYLFQPHTSSGRVPTDRAYRVFVDLLIETGHPTKTPFSVEQTFQKEAARSPLMQDLMVSFAHAVTRATQHVGFTMAEGPAPILQHIEFVPLGGSRVLVVVVARGGQVTQKVVDSVGPAHPSDLSQASNYLNSEFAGLPLDEVRTSVEARLLQERTLYDRLMSRALRLASSTLNGFPTSQGFHVEGAASLLSITGRGEATLSLSTLRTLVELMEEKQRLLHLLSEYVEGPGLTVVIGAEHLTPDLRPFSLVASTSDDGGSLRTVGVIGPTRMRYSQAISVVDAAARTMTDVLRNDH
jgi:heat-inducible transcriptional repressor